MNISLPNSPESLAEKVDNGRIPLRRAWMMLVLRLAISFALLLVLAVVYQLAGNNSAIADSAARWLWSVTAANITCIVLLFRFGRLEGLRLREIYFVSRAAWKGDPAWFLLAGVVSAVVVMPPGTLLAQALWGDANFPTTCSSRRCRCGPFTHCSYSCPPLRSCLNCPPIGVMSRRASALLG